MVTASLTKLPPELFDIIVQYLNPFERLKSREVCRRLRSLIPPIIDLSSPTSFAKVEAAATAWNAAVQKELQLRPSTYMTDEPFWRLYRSLLQACGQCNRLKQVQHFAEEMLQGFSVLDPSERFCLDCGTKPTGGDKQAKFMEGDRAPYPPGCHVWSSYSGYVVVCWVCGRLEKREMREIKSDHNFCSDCEPVHVRREKEACWDAEERLVTCHD